MKLTKCLNCNKSLVFENINGKFEEYEVDESGNKRCFDCHQNFIEDENEFI
tara:strand:+ start:341 stop:493 length:153 start_codon:yes stop_codon:yes gene_type:complete